MKFLIDRNHNVPKDQESLIKLRLLYLLMEKTGETDKLDETLAGFDYYHFNPRDILKGMERNGTDPELYLAYLFISSRNGFLYTRHDNHREWKIVNEHTSVDLLRTLIAETKDNSQSTNMLSYMGTDGREFFSKPSPMFEEGIIPPHSDDIALSLLTLMRDSVSSNFQRMADCRRKVAMIFPALVSEKATFKQLERMLVAEVKDVLTHLGLPTSMLDESFSSDSNVFHHHSYDVYLKERNRLAHLNGGNSHLIPRLYSHFDRKGCRNTVFVKLHCDYHTPAKDTLNTGMPLDSFISRLVLTKKK